MNHFPHLSGDGRSTLAPTALVPESIQDREWSVFCFPETNPIYPSCLFRKEFTYPRVLQLTQILGFGSLEYWSRTDERGNFFGPRLVFPRETTPRINPVRALAISPSASWART
jgi:hypothetical protein